MFYDLSQISSLQEKLQEMGDRLQEKDFDLLQKDQFLNHLHKELEKKQATLTEMEQVSGLLLDSHSNNFILV